MYILLLESFFSAAEEAFSLYTSAPEGNHYEHCHEFNELVIVREGFGLHVINGKPHFIQQGDVFYVREGDFHFYDQLGTLALTNILINPRQPMRWLSSVTPLLTRFNAAQPGNSHWLPPQRLAHCQQLIRQMFSPPAGTPAELVRGWQEAHFFQLLMQMLVEEPASSHTRNKIHHLLNFLQQHCFEPTDWEALGAQFYLSKRTLQRQIKETTGLTPDNYIKRLRLVTAREKLNNTDESITDIAYLCGFANSNHFATCYKQLFGLTPSQQRQGGAASQTGPLPTRVTEFFSLQDRVQSS